MSNCSQNERNAFYLKETKSFSLSCHWGHGQGDTTRRSPCAEAVLPTATKEGPAVPSSRALGQDVPVRGGLSPARESPGALLLL